MNESTMEAMPEDQALAASRHRERGGGTVEWLGISALSIGLLVAIFAALESLGLRLIEAIGSQLGL